MIPPFTIDGVLPPFVGARGPGDTSQYMTPYQVSAVDVAARFGTTPERRNILMGWLRHRAALRTAGLARGFQWLDGSFVEDKPPNDIDVVTFAYGPDFSNDPSQAGVWVAEHGFLSRRSVVKWLFKVDAFEVDLRGNPETIVDATRYFGGLFSHRRGDSLWKGMLSVRLEDPADDQAALAALNPPPAAAVPGVGP